MTRNAGKCLTGIIKDEDTVATGVRVGGRVRCIMGELKGVEGYTVATRSAGRVLVQLAAGLYFEVPRICVKRVDAPDE